MPKRRRKTNLVPDKARRKVPWGLQKQQRKAGLFIKFVLEVEKALPGATGAEKKAWVKQKLDSLINLPPIAEEISDFIINVGTEIAYAGVQAAKTADDMVVLERSEYEELLKLKDAYADLHKQYTDLYEQVTNPPEEG